MCDLFSSFLFNDISVLALFNSFLAIYWEWATLALNIILSSILTFVHVYFLCKRPLILSKHRQFCYFFTICVIWLNNLSTLALASNITKQHFTIFDSTGYFSSLFWSSISIISNQYLYIGHTYPERVSHSQKIWFYIYHLYIVMISGLCYI